MLRARLVGARLVSMEAVDVSGFVFGHCEEVELCRARGVDHRAAKDKGSSAYVYMFRQFATDDRIPTAE